MPQVVFIAQACDEIVVKNYKEYFKFRKILTSIIGNSITLPVTVTEALKISLR